MKVAGDLRTATGQLSEDSEGCCWNPKYIFRMGGMAINGSGSE